MLLIFDIDGVLHDNVKLGPARRNARMKAIAEKFKVSQDEAASMFESAKQRMSEERKHTTVYVLMELGYTYRQALDIINLVDPRKLLSLSPELRKLFHSLQHHTIVAYSNSPTKAAVQTLEALGIEKFFSAVYTPVELGESKPSTKNLLFILKDQKCNPKDAVLIVDSIQNDIEPAKAVGVRTILVNDDVAELLNVLLKNL